MPAPTSKPDQGQFNAEHGNAWEFLRNEALNANTYFRNQTGQPRGVLRQNQFGFTLGGSDREEQAFLLHLVSGYPATDGIDCDCSPR